jgi:hypothetical protein
MTIHTTQKHQDNLADKAPPTGLSHQGACRGKGGYSPSTTAFDLRRQADVRARTIQEMGTRDEEHTTDSTDVQERRQDRKRVPARGRRHSAFGPCSPRRTMNEQPKHLE